MTRKIVTIVGARPQFIKAAAVSRAIRSEFSDCLEEVMVHTGQHYDANMSQVFFDELEIPPPHYNLEISGGNHGAMTGRMLEGVERILLDERPDWVLVYGDTNSTLAGALAAAKLHIPVAHVEAGLRSFNMRMPEEINRILTDRVSTLLFCPTDAAVSNLAAEGVTNGVGNIGDVMYDVALYYHKRCDCDTVLKHYGVAPGSYVLATCHRAENTDSTDRLREICLGLAHIAAELPVILPLHPRTRKLLSDNGLSSLLTNVKLVEPLAFMEMVALEQSARVILTDSGGVQKEAFFYEVPCVTMREETEWVETLEMGWNQLVGANSKAIYKAVVNAGKPPSHLSPFGDGTASQKILKTIVRGG